MILLVDSLALDDLAEAERYYAEHAGLEVAQRFVAEADRVLALLGTATPNASSAFDGGARFRHLRLRRFPYWVVFEDLAADRRMVWAIAHEARAPGHWRARTGAR